MAENEQENSAEGPQKKMVKFKRLVIPAIIIIVLAGGYAIPTVRDTLSHFVTDKIISLFQKTPASENTPAKPSSGTPSKANSAAQGQSQAPANAKANPAAAALPAVTNKPQEVILLTVKIGAHLLAMRQKIDGSCKTYLSTQGFQVSYPAGQGWDDFAPVASGNGKHLAFYSSRSGAINLWVSDADGRNARALTQEGVDIHAFDTLRDAPVQFSPDSLRVAFLNRGDLWMADLKSDNITTLTKDRGVEAMAWSPDGKWLAYYQRSSVRRVGSSGAPDESLTPSGANWATLAFHPDAEREELYYFNRGVWSLNLATRTRQQIFPTNLTPNRIRLSPKGDQVTFSSMSAEQRPEVFLLLAAKKVGAMPEASQLTRGGGTQPFFSQDGKIIFFMRGNSLWKIGTGADKVDRIEGIASAQGSASMMTFMQPMECP